MAVVIFWRKALHIFRVVYLTLAFGVFIRVNVIDVRSYVLRWQVHGTLLNNQSSERHVSLMSMRQIMDYSPERHSRKALRFRRIGNVTVAVVE